MLATGVGFFTFSNGGLTVGLRRTPLGRRTATAGWNRGGSIPLKTAGVTPCSLSHRLDQGVSPAVVYPRWAGRCCQHRHLDKDYKSCQNCLLYTAPEYTIQTLPNVVTECSVRWLAVAYLGRFTILTQNGGKEIVKTTDNKLICHQRRITIAHCWGKPKHHQLKFIASKVIVWSAGGGIASMSWILLVNSPQPSHSCTASVTSIELIEQKTI